MRIVITGADGFIGTNLRMRLAELGHAEVACITLCTPADAVQAALTQAEFVFHLAGVNRPQDPAEFATGNAGLTQDICAALAAAGRRATVVLASSTQALQNNPYGRSKLAAEEVVRGYAAATGAPVHVFRLTNVFGKWAQPNYNSAVATFCHNVARGLPITVNDPAAPLQLAYIDDVVERFVQLLEAAGDMDCRASLAMTNSRVTARPQAVAVHAGVADMTAGGQSFVTVEPQYTTTVGELARLIQSFKDSRDTLMTERVGTGLVRALYATYVSYLPVESFAYALPTHADPRGTFVEMLKTPDCGQFSFLTAQPGATRGGHYHHSKTEKFLVIRGQARFKFRHMQTGQTHELFTSGDKFEIVETVPGWTHDITNIGTDEMFVMLWANEVFDRERPDTFACPV
jgi:UDP-2-acetamido-2,6-beta-L-arabino-hexul-4-ose reductase